MRSATALPVLAMAVVVSCATPREPTPAQSPTETVVAERGPTRAEREAARASDRSASATEPEPLPAPSAILRITPSSASEGEDGSGEIVAASAPVHLDVHRAGGWPGRALDPRLVVGGLEFRRYRHAGAEILRFVAADGDALRRDAEIWVQWGDEESSRLDVALDSGGGNGGGDLDL